MTRQDRNSALTVDRLSGIRWARLQQWRETTPMLPESAFGLAIQDILPMRNLVILAAGAMPEDLEDFDPPTRGETERMLQRAGYDRSAGIELLCLTAPEIAPYELIPEDLPVNPFVAFVLRFRLGATWREQVLSRTAHLIACGWEEEEARRITRDEYSFRNIEGLTRPPRLHRVLDRVSNWGRVIFTYPSLHRCVWPALAPWIDEGRDHELAALLSNMPTVEELERRQRDNEGVDIDDLVDFEDDAAELVSLLEAQHAAALSGFRENFWRRDCYRSALRLSGSPAEIDPELSRQLYAAITTDLPGWPPPLSLTDTAARLRSPYPPDRVLLNWARTEAAPFIARFADLPESLGTPTVQ